MIRTSAKNRRTTKIRRQIASCGRVRLSVHRTNENIYAQLIDVKGVVLAATSSLDKEVQAQFQNSEVKTKTGMATIVGDVIGKKALALGVQEIAFDRSGFPYHGRVEALAQSARAAGLSF